MSDAHECPMCGGWGVPLGSLGRKEWFHCRQCGWEFSAESDPTPAAARPETDQSSFPES